ncbi:MAG: hypothetical protein IJK52_01630 [Oscillospiraceae bacterium]|nr:hypothetical protein [Oscillospiraceae bacterium]
MSDTLGAACFVSDRYGPGFPAPAVGKERALTKKKLGGPLYNSTRVLKALGYIVFCMGLGAGTLTILFAWPNTLEKMMSYGFNIMICLIEVTFFLVMALLICVFADMLDCLLDIQESVNEACAALKKESKTEE